MLRNLSTVAVLWLLIGNCASAQSPQAVPATGVPSAKDKEKDENPYLAKIDKEIADPEVRAAIRRVQPACVRLLECSGVNVSRHGAVLTAAHAVKRLNEIQMITFPDGHRYAATCAAIDRKFDLALFRITTKDELPFAELAQTPPEEGIKVVCIGHPDRVTAKGQPTHYEPFTVSTGHIRGFLSDPLGPQALGRTKHDAWTYWGHSGSPLFNEAGEIVAMHNSWDPSTKLRHAVTLQAIADFLKRNPPDKPK